jgi:ferrochelatase
MNRHAYDVSTGRVGVLVMSHGTPHSLEEVPAFYTAIRRGTRPSQDEIDDLVRRYQAIGGTSPLAAITASQVAGLTRTLERARPGRFVVASGTKYSSPLIEEAVFELVDSRVGRVIGIVLAPHSSTVSVGEYARRAREALSSATGEPRGNDIGLRVVDHWHLEPGLTSLWADNLKRALRESPPDTTEVLFSAHSIPMRAVEHGDTYAQQVQESAEAVAKEAEVERWRVVWQSAGRAGGSWLGPDMLSVIPSLPGEGVTAVVVCPFGFVSDHLEVLYDVDVEAARRAHEAGLTFTRVVSPNGDPRLSEVLSEVVLAADGDH